MATTQQQIEGGQFVQYFGPLLDALRTLGGSGTPSEVVEQIAADLTSLLADFRTMHMNHRLSALFSCETWIEWHHSKQRS